jgi:phosphoribosylformimino-5-aminoimidazole carboxamide ribotide isomerase
MAIRPEIDPGDALALASAYITTCGLSELYVADLDAIIDHHPQATLVAAIARLDTTLWLDAGVRSEDEARAAASNGASRIVVGLETLPSFGVLRSMVEAIGSEHLVFSLDLRDRRPLASATRLAVRRPDELVRAATDAGISTVIVLDLARVGTDTGPDLDLIERLRRASPAITLIAGGGVRHIGDLTRLEHVGCDGALVATALLSGRLTAADLGTVLSL